MKSKNRLTLLLLALALVALVGTGVWTWKRPGSANPRAALAPGSSGFALTSLQLKRGDALEYELSLTGQTRGAPKVYQMAGTLRLLVLEEESQSYRVALQFTSERTEGFDQLDPGFRAALFAGFKEPVVAHLGRYGFDLTLDSQEPAIGMSREFWQGLADRSRVLLPARIVAHQFDQKEFFYGESLNAHYALTDSDPKSKEVLIFEKAIASAAAAKRSVQGQSTIRMNEGATRVESIEFRSNEGIPNLQLSSENSLNLRYLRQFAADSQEMASTEKRASAPRAAEERMDDTIQANVLGSLSLSDVWSGMEKEVDQKSYLLLKAWIQLHPAELANLSDRLKALANDDPKLRASIKALTAVGSPEAQKLMINLLDAHKGDPVGQRIASSLGFVAHPTPDVEQALNSLVRSTEFPELGRRAELALGGVGGALRKSDANDQTRAQALEKSALERLTASKEKRESLTTLGMMGNLGPSEREKLATYLKSPDPALRAQTYFAMRFAVQTDTPQFLVEAYKTETVSGVRKQILQALSLRQPDVNWYSAIDALTTGATLPDEDQTVLAQALVRNARTFKSDSIRLLTAMQSKTSSDNLKKALSEYQALAQKSYDL